MTDEQTEQTEGQGLQGHDPSQETDPAALTEEQEANRDSDAATQGDQGPQVREQTPTTTGPGAVTSSDPNVPVAQSPPPPDAQSGVPPLQSGENEGVEPGTPGPVEPGGGEGTTPGGLTDAEGGVATGGDEGE